MKREMPFFDAICAPIAFSVRRNPINSLKDLDLLNLTLVAGFASSNSKV
jgi:hypothetical protein